MVEERSRLGNWEADTVIGKGHRGALVTVEERSTRSMLAHSVRRRTKEETSNALLSMLSPLSAWVLAITCDNGREFSSRMHVAAELDCDGYFARPHRSCDRGTNENGNRLPRQCFPKTMPFHEMTPE